MIFSSFPPGSRAAKVYLWFRIFFLVAIAVLVGRFFLTYRTWTVPRQCLGMSPVFTPGRSVVVHNGIRAASQLQRGDIVIFGVRDPRTGAKGELMSRVMGLPGETVGIVAGRVHIDRREIDDPWSAANGPPPESLFVKPVTVQPGAVYVLNDDRLSPTPDSRILGAIPEKAITGKVVLSL